MKLSIKKMAVLFAALLLIGSQLAFGQVWNLFYGLPLRETPQIVKAVSSHPPFLLAASSNELFVSRDNGKTWRQTLRVPGSDTKINSVEVSPDNLKIWYALTATGLYRSKNSGKNWSKTRSGHLLSIARHPFESGVIYLGSDNGVLVSRNNGDSWASVFAGLSGKPVWHIAADRENGQIFFAAGNGLYRYHIGRDHFRKVFTAPLASMDDDPEADGISIEDDVSSSVLNPFVRSIVISASDDLPFPIAMGTKQGVFTSHDEGETWERLPAQGLRTAEVSDLAFSETAQTLFAATKRGIFKYDVQNKIWKEIYEGLASGETFKLSIQREPKEVLVAATRGGVFYYEITAPVFKPEVEFPRNPEFSGKLIQLIEREPAVRDLQLKAIQYANTTNWKIKRWHTTSRLKALVPDVRFAKGLDVSNRIHVDTGGTANPDFFTQGPDDRDKSTDISLTWNLGDFLFSSSQTSIDSREKLMVELRDKILNEVTRIYFERRRAQMEFAMNPPEDPLERINALLRIEELTANLDALTNGYLSKKLNQLYTGNGGLDQFWQSSFEKNGSEL